MLSRQNRLAMPVSTVRLLKDRRGFTRPVHIFNPSTAVETRHCNRPFPIWYRYNLRLNKLGFNLGINLGSTWRVLATQPAHPGGSLRTVEYEISISSVPS